jgi:hypothetical protein
MFLPHFSGFLNCITESYFSLLVLSTFSIYTKQQVNPGVDYEWSGVLPKAVWHDRRLRGIRWNPLDRYKR